MCVCTRGRVKVVRHIISSYNLAPGDATSLLSLPEKDITPQVLWTHIWQLIKLAIRGVNLELDIVTTCNIDCRIWYAIRYDVDRRQRC